MHSTTRSAVTAATLLTLLALLPGGVGAQSLADRVGAVRDGRVQLHFASRAQMCGDGENFVSTGENRFFGSMEFASRGNWKERCLPGPVRVVLGVRNGEVYSVRRTVGPLPERPPQGVTDLGEVSARTATDYLLALAPRLSGSTGDQAIEAAAFADGVTIWPRLLTIARERSAPHDTRETARFWIAQAAANAITGTDAPGDDYSDGSSEAEHAIFVLSELDHGAGIPDLIQIARTHANPRLRARAIFWLGESDDPRGLELFEEILRRPESGRRN